MRRILIVAATGFEIVPLGKHLMECALRLQENEFQYRNDIIRLLVTGPGMIHTVFHLSDIARKESFDLVLNAGICGSFDRRLPIGETVIVRQDRYGDLGVEDSDGRFTDLFELELLDPLGFPYHSGSIINDHKEEHFHSFKEVTAISVNKVHGSPESIRQIEEKYSPQVETMEGAGFFYTCKSLGLPCIQLRSISNYVEPRDRNNWKIDLAIDQLNRHLVHFINSL